ncbi:MAG TPA: CsgG/HfaB family protein [bacterium]|nr:CsgG/HfaB family protein [bacterium]HPR89106.1 CsgG/HfaB family protein [bacterium]
MGHVRRMLVVLLVGLTVSGWAVQESPGKRTLAVLDFENNSLKDKAEMDPLCKGLSDMLITELSKVQAFQIVERANLQQILEEMKLGQSGMIETSAAQEVGKMLGAQNLILGSFMKMLDGKLRIDARLVEVESGKTLMAEEETGSPNDLAKMVTNLVNKNIKSMNVSLSGEERKALREPDNNSFDAALLFARGIDFEEKGNLTEARRCYLQALKLNPKFRRARARLLALRKGN